VLKYLVANDGRLISKDTLIADVWEGRAVTDGSLGKCIEEVRDALGVDAAKCIRNVRGRGYLFDSALHGSARVSDSPVPEPQLADTRSIRTGHVDLATVVVDGREEASGGRAAPLHQPGGKKALVLGTAGVVMAMAIGAVGYYLFRTTSARPTSVPIAEIRSLAVLPFRPLVVRDRNEALEMGMADSVITRLSGLAGIEVRPLSAVRQYTELTQDPSEAGRQVRVDAVLDGSIQRSGGRVRVTVRLVRVVDGRQLWADQFDEEFRDIFAVQDSISERVTGELALKMTGEEKKRLTKRYTENLPAYQSYLQGRLHALRLTRTDLFAALRNYERAIEADASYALAYAGLADVYSNMVSRGYISTGEGRSKAFAMAQKALSIDLDLAEAHVAVGQVHTFSAPFDFAAGDRALRRAISLSPRLAIAHHFLAVSLLEQGRLDESLDEWRKARELDPLSPRTARAFAYAYVLKRDYARALDLLRQARELGPAFTISREVEIYIQSGTLDEALAELEKAGTGRANDPLVLFSTGMVYAAQGRRAEALRVADTLEKMSGASLTLADLIARIHATLGDTSAALLWLQRGLKAGAIPIFYKDAPLWDNARAHGDFAVLLRQMGIQP
jgi:serine/threonine-protein kinase